MASISKRRNGDGSTSWDAMVRIVGYPATGKSFRTKHAAELWAARAEAAAKGGTLATFCAPVRRYVRRFCAPRGRSPACGTSALSDELGGQALEKLILARQIMALQQWLNE